MQLQTIILPIERVVELAVQLSSSPMSASRCFFGRAGIGALLLDERLIVLLEHSMRHCDRSTNSGESFFCIDQWSSHLPQTR
jgi:hypothetical protein